MMKKAVGFIKNRTMAMAFNRWREMSEERKEMRRKVGRCKLDPGLKAPGFKSST